MPSTRRAFLEAGAISLAAAGLAPLSALPKTPSGAGGPQELENLVRGIEPLGTGDYAARIEKARRLLAERGLDAIFIGGGVNLVYFTKVRWWLSERVFGLVLGRKAEPIWVCPAFEAPRAQELVPAGQEIRTWEEHENPYATIGGVLKDISAATGTLGTAPDLRAFEVHGLARTLTAARVVDGSAITEGCRGVKTAREIAYMDLANRVTKLAFREGFKALRAGMTARDLAGAIAAATQKMGAQGGGGPQFGPNTAFPHGSQVPRTLTGGDCVLVDGGCSVEGYGSDVTRTVVFGRPSDKQRRVWDIVRKAQQAALAAARPGATCESVDAAARRVIEDAGFGPGYKHFAHRLGHGIGLEGHEYPYLVKGNRLKLEPGMTFSNEPGVYIYGEFGIRTEDCLVVTESGARHLGGLEAVSIEEPFGAD
ncbi:MAG TPA: Xaa-Pro peptidase family protein [Candidatus Aminicenantes bacterium]|nr:Xaa-Pro peptidase family protein [Candidatus Aminicenantes bacterium]HRY66104.1 Xaa-Pro peptidase family protein [Candidatus Aminicenantes bacterium]HRZ73018.1 Xaa-Pro peptidase family protein [Candidatus Aminicenantes bacterium]